MNYKFKYLLAFAVCLVLWWVFVVSRRQFPLNSQRGQNVPDRPQNLGDPVLRVSVYYEALCSDSRNFFVKQLLPAYSVLHEYVDVALVPYGKAETFENNGEITFQCQHAHIECLGNKIHACAIELIADPMLQLQYTTCMIQDNIVPFEAAERCAGQHKVDYPSIVDCSNSDKSSLLLKAHGVRTKAVQPTISFIPTIDVRDAPHISLSELLKDFKGVLCQQLLVVTRGVAEHEQRVQALCTSS